MRKFANMFGMCSAIVSKDMVGPIVSMAFHGSADCQGILIVGIVVAVLSSIEKTSVCFEYHAMLQKNQFVRMPIDYSHLPNELEIVSPLFYNMAL